MNTVKYNKHNLAKNSQAYELWETYNKTKTPEDKKKLDKHLKEVDERHKELLDRYK